MHELPDPRSMGESLLRRMESKAGVAPCMHPDGPHARRDGRLPTPGARSSASRREGEREGEGGGEGEGEGEGEGLVSASW